MFTDIVDFTATTESGGERAAMRLLDAHDALVTPHVRNARGRVVKSLGDGIMAAFPDPAGAAEAAVGILEDLREEHTGNGRLRLRIGIDTGQPRRRGDDFVGHTVNVAARLTRRARPGEALVTDAVRSASHGALHAKWTERGAVSLKGVSRPPKMWRLRPGPPGRNGARPKG
jgi:adenylate cyclase